MEQLTAEGLKVVNDLAQRYGFSQEAVIQMMFAMLKGRGQMAQFSHPEFAGSGQWMAGGMLMLGDMFNHALKARVDGLCQAIAGLLASQSELFPVGGFQSQSQSGGGHQQQVGSGAGQQMQVSGPGAGPQQQTARAGMTPMAPMGSMPPMAPMAPASGSLFVADPRDTWWPAELGSPSATGAQNDMRYAYFPDSGRLAVQVNGQVGIYDAGEHRIGGFSQQQGGGGGVVFSTPAGVVSLSSLAAVSGAIQQAQNSGTGSQHQSSISGGGGHQMQFSGGGMAPMSGMSPMAPMPPMTFGADPGGTWWPADLGSPSATGSQNDVRYAHFADSGRLAVEVNGQLAVYDTRDLAITGLAQQGSGGELVFSTPGGSVSLASLPKLPLPGEAQPSEAEAVEPAGQQPSPTTTEDVLGALERLGELQRKGILTEAEFAAKKEDLLRRL
jgi:hypothetical protein